MACTGNEQIENIPDIANPNDGIDVYVSACVAYDNWFTTEAVPKLNAMYPCINGWYGTISDWHTEIETWHSEVHNWHDEAKEYRDEAQTIADGISSVLPDGTISDGEVATNKAWSSEKIVSEIKAQSITNMVRVGGKLSEIHYQDGAKEKLTRDANGVLQSVIYTETDGTTTRYTETFGYNADGKIITITRN